MFFRLTNTIYTNNKDKANSIKQVAYGRILRYRMYSAEILMDQYLQKKYKKTLKQICKELFINNIKINYGGDDNTIIITFTDKKSNDLASLITYGNSEVQGIKILTYAFNQNF